MKVEGHCPMGCGPTLHAAGSPPRVCCGGQDCPEPTAVDRILSDPETEHIVEVGSASFSVKHPLRERVDDELLVCRLHSTLSICGGPPVPPGTYRAVADTGPATIPGWRLERIDEEGGDGGA